MLKVFLKSFVCSQIIVAFALTAPLLCQAQTALPFEQSQSAKPSVVLGVLTSCAKKTGTMEKAENCKTHAPTAEESDLAKDSFADLNAILGSQEFKDAVLLAHFEETNGKSSEQIYSSLVNNGKPINVDLTFYTGGIILNHYYHNQGFEDDDSPNICFGNCHAIQGKRGFLGSLLLHESMHVLGFHHYDDPVTASVPYMMNTIYDQVAQKLGLSTSYANVDPK